MAQTHAPNARAGRGGVNLLVERKIIASYGYLAVDASYRMVWYVIFSSCVLIRAVITGGIDPR